jgi:hypothetical protein
MAFFVVMCCCLRDGYLACRHIVLMGTVVDHQEKGNRLKWAIQTEAYDEIPYESLVTTFISYEQAS